MDDLAVIVVSTNDANWLEPCLSTLHAHAGALRLDVVIADNESTDDTAELIRTEFPSARVVPCRNLGFGHANNRALLTCDARYVLFLNPDTEILAGSLEDLIEVMDQRPEIGIASVRQVTADGQLYPTIRHFPSPLRALGEALGVERWPRSPEWLRERVLDPAQYARETACDWMTGAFVLARAEALYGAGIFDERFFMSSEETDLAYRVKQAGWTVVHLPQMTILHHVHMGAPLGERMEAQYAFSRLLFANKHMPVATRGLYLTCLRVRYRIRLLRSLRPRRQAERPGAKRALRALRGSEAPPFGMPPPVAVARRGVTETGCGRPVAAP